MVGYTAPNRYQPRAKWRDKLDGWLRSPPTNAGSWQMDIYHYWNWTTKEGMSLQDAWTRLRMSPNNAETSLHPNAADTGLIPPELFSRVLARSRAQNVESDDAVAVVIVDPEPAGAAAAADEGEPEVGYTDPNEYRPRAKWKDKLDGWLRSPPGNAGSWQMDIYLYWRWTTKEGMSSQDAWAQLRMHPNNARTSLHRNSADKGLIPPELFSRVLARSRASTVNPNDDVAEVIVHPEPTA